MGTKFDRRAGALRAHVEVNDVEGEEETEGVLTAPEKIDTKAAAS